MGALEVNYAISNARWATSARRSVVVEKPSPPDSWTDETSRTISVGTWLLPRSHEFEVSEQRLRDHAQAKVQRIVERASARDGIEIAAVDTLRAVFYLSSPNGPSPQVAEDDDGLETEWVVNGNSVVLHCSFTGENLLWAMDPDGKVLFSESFSTRWLASERVVHAAKQRLEQMSGEIEARIPLDSI